MLIDVGVDRQVIGWRVLYDKTRRSDGKRKSVTDVIVREALRAWHFHHEHKMNAITSLAHAQHASESIAVADTSPIVSVYRARE